MSNPRKTDGPKEGDPGDTMVITVTDVMPPKVYMALIMDDGYFADEVYDQIDSDRREYQRARLRDD